MAPPRVRNILFGLAVVLVGATGFAALAVAQGSPLPHTRKRKTAPVRPLGIDRRTPS